MNKIFALLIVVLMVTEATAKMDSLGSNQEKGRPNIIFIMSDDHAYQAISAYSNHLIETPNIDRLASEGMFFRNHYS